jgi:HK97 family phage major capsid protein
MTQNKMATKTLPTNKVQHRTVELDRGAINEDDRTVELAFSSEEPVERSFGREVLDHDPKSVNLERLNGGAPLLLEHDRTQQIGVIENARIDPDRVGRATVRFSRSPLGQEIFQDISDGIRRMTSVGYRVDEFVQDSVDDGESEVYRAKNWSPLEVSIVSIPSDIQVGIARNEDEPETEPEPLAEPEPEPASKDEAETPQNIMEEKTEKTIEVKADKRAENIAAIGRQFNASDEALTFISEGKSADQFKDFLLEQRANEPVAVPSDEREEIGLSDKEVESYSLTRAIEAVASGRPQDAGLEMEASQAVAKRTGKSPRGFFLPNDVTNRFVGQRDLTAGASAAGAKLVDEIVQVPVIEALRARMVMGQLGATVLSGLSSNVSVPKVTTGAAGSWVAENAAPSETTQVIGQVTLSPKTCAAYTDISRRLLVQSSADVESLIRNDITNSLAVAIDTAAVNGGGSNEPTGIIQHSDVTITALGTNGAAPSYANMCAVEAAPENSNAAMGTMQFLTNAKVRKKLRQVEIAANSGLMLFDWRFNTILGYPTTVSNIVPSTLTKGSSSVCSGIIFGDFSQVLIGYFGPGIDVLVDPYTGGNAGTVRVSALVDVDVNLRHGAALSVIKDATTA